MFVAVAGGIAAGKSTAVDVLAHELGVAAHPERPEANPWFGHSDRTAAAQREFLDRSIEQAALCQRAGGVLERHPVEHVEVMARWHAAHGRLTPGELGSLRARLAEAAPPRPDVVVILSASPAVLLSRIARRGRPEERFLESSDLLEIGTLIDATVAHIADRTLRVDTERLDLRRIADVESLARQLSGQD